MVILSSSFFNPTLKASMMAKTFESATSRETTAWSDYSVLRKSATNWNRSKKSKD